MMSTYFADSTFFDIDNLISVLYRTETMGGDDDCLSFSQIVDVIYDSPLVVGI